MGHVLDRDVHAEVAARHHDRRDRSQDAGEVHDALVALELGDDRYVGTELVQGATHLRDVRLRPHERDGDEVHAVREAETEVLAVLVGEARDGQRHARERDPLVIAEAPADDDAATYLLGRRLLDAELDHPVVHPDLVARMHVREVLGVVQRRALRRAHDGLRAERENLAGLEIDPRAARGAEGAEPDLRPLQILKNRDRSAPASLTLADQPDDLGVLGVGAVGEVHAGDVHARGDEAVELGSAAAGRPEGANDLGPPHARYPRSRSVRRNWPVYERVAWRAISSGVPVATTRPPSSPPSGPRSMIQSAVLITSRLCSMITTVLP